MWKTFPMGDIRRIWSQTCDKKQQQKDLYNNSGMWKTFPIGDIQRNWRQTCDKKQLTTQTDLYDNGGFADL